MTDTTLDAENLLHLSQAEIEGLFRSVSEPGPIPAGEARGTVIVAPGTELSETAAKLAHLIAWQGKVFDPDSGDLRNEIGPFGYRAVRAKVYRDQSWFDSQASIVLDYSQTSLIAHWIRDEIRQVGPGLYLGIVFWERKKILDFCLQFPS
jgi:hypothetical protein